MKKPDKIKILYLIAICSFFILFFSKAYSKKDNNFSETEHTDVEVVEKLIPN